MHDKGFAHRDLKIDNVVIDQDYELKLIDLSFVCDAFLPQTLKCGTLSYQAPELLDETKEYQAIWVDIFALGIILFYLVSGQLPFFKAQSTDPKYDKVIKE
jgi:serine/threonine protein kinase